ncbi:substrate-binding periplasmic protein [Rhodoferax bucti]|uniref:substrate-binding periplasmic protein n=1 Tax=Rhodoferax bucti TaxID=2576305 RepID=UPI0014770B02|nr:transporter substrate-binding domain-containing protein [Rhodoferax bucti]
MLYVHTRRILTTFLLFGMLISTANAERRSPVLLQLDDSNPPFMYAIDGEPAGVYPALVKAVFARAGVPVQLQAKPWVRVLNDVDRGHGGIGGVYRTNQRARKWDFSTPLLTENIAVFLRKDANWTFTDFSDLNDRTIGTVRGWSYGESFNTARAIPLLSAEDTQSDRINLRKLASGRLDAVLAVEEAGNIALKSMGISTIAQAGRYLSANPAHIAFAKSSGRTALLQQLNKAIADLKREGEINRIFMQELNRHTAAEALKSPQ